MSEEVEIKEEEVVKAEPDLYQIFIKGKIDNEEMRDHFESINRLPYGSGLIIWLSSPGGIPQVALMFDDKLRAKGLNVTYISYLFNGSTACTLPHLSDAIRLTYHHSVFTFHGATVSVCNRKGQFEMVKNYADEGIEKINTLMMETIGLTKKEFRKYDENDIIIYGYTLLDVGTHGMIDGIILKEIDVGQFLIKTRDGNKIIDVSKHKRSDIKDLPLVE